MLKFIHIKSIRISIKDPLLLRSPPFNNALFPIPNYYKRQQQMTKNLIAQPFSQLTTTQLYEILRLRSQVFVVEQNCPYLDIDGQDQESIHLWLENPDHTMMAYLRILPKTTERKNIMIGRVVVHPDFRKQGLAQILLKEAFIWIQKEWGNQPIEISAQSYLLKFYKDLGFKPISEIYLEDNIEHLDMLRVEE